ncbi:ATP-NAD kinase-like domain-containing protein [Scenedesmus sp. NREL 46B-D3]|nr:ATP-NAD kinase-like domain-containing protein [Scenedesmus sp. NREL 46B-D3]
MSSPCILPSQGAGGRTRHAWSKAAPLVRHRLQLAEYKLVERFTTAPGEAVQLAADAVAAGAAAVLAVGGDGTIHEVVNGMMAQSQQEAPGVAPATALGVLPLGTGSDFIRTFGWKDNDVSTSCDRITSGKRQAIDVGRVIISRCSHSTSTSNSSRRVQQDAAGASSSAPAVSTEQHQQQGTAAEVKYFVNICSCGVGATTPAIVNKLKWLRTLSYPVASVVALLKYKPLTVQVSCDGGPWKTVDQLTMLVVGNGVYWGGGMRVFPHASTCDGLMDAMVVQRMGLLDFITKGHLLRSGDYNGVQNVTLLPPCKSLTIKPLTQAAGSAAAPLAAAPAGVPWWELDGEGQGPCSNISIELLPSVLQLCV